MTHEQIERAIACVTDREARDFMARVLWIIHADGPGETAIADYWLPVEIAEAFPPATDQYTNWDREKPCTQCGRAERDRIHATEPSAHPDAHTYRPRPVSP